MEAVLRVPISRRSVCLSVWWSFLPWRVVFNETFYSKPHLKFITLLVNFMLTIYRYSHRLHIIFHNLNF